MSALVHKQIGVELMTYLSYSVGKAECSSRKLLLSAQDRIIREQNFAFITSLIVCSLKESVDFDRTLSALHDLFDHICLTFQSLCVFFCAAVFAQNNLKDLLLVS